MTDGKLIIFSAPSGSGKSSIINAIIERGFPLKFSVSATSRPPRGTEKDGCEYYFLTEEDFRKQITQGAFLEYEEVYPGRFYGTLKSEVDDRLSKGENIVLDIDVKGALNIKKIYDHQALTIFIMPPSVTVLRERLVKRGTDNEEVIQQRISKAEYELSFSDQFDKVVVNDDLSQACNEVSQILTNLLNKE